jgi:phosphoglycolate phosphatase
MAHETVAILFDIDGTLITTGGAGAVGWRKAFEDLYGIPADIGQFTDAGMTDPEVGRLTFKAVLDREPTKRELAQVLARRQEYLPEVVAEAPGYKVLDGVEELLPKLAHEGFVLGLTTGGTEMAAAIKLTRANLLRWFAVGGYGSDSTNRTELTKTAIRRVAKLIGEHVEPEQCLVVGDTPLDVKAAKGAGAVAVAVASGHFTVEQLEETGADAVLSSLREELPITVHEAVA